MPCLWPGMRGLTWLVLKNFLVSSLLVFISRIPLALALCANKIQICSVGYRWKHERVLET